MTDSFLNTQQTLGAIEEDIKHLLDSDRTREVLNANIFNVFSKMFHYAVIVDYHYDILHRLDIGFYCTGHISFSWEPDLVHSFDVRPTNNPLDAYHRAMSIL